MLKLSSSHGPVPSGPDEPADGGVEDGGRRRDVQQLTLREPLQDVADQQDHGVVAHQQDALAGVAAVEVGQQGAKPQCDVGPGLAARRTVVELAQPPPSFGFFGEPGLHARGGEHVQDPELAVAQPFIDEDRRRPAAGLHGQFRCLARPGVGEDQTAVRSVLGNPASSRPRASACSRPVSGQLDVGVPGRNVDHVRPGLVGQRGGHVSLALAVPHQHQFRHARRPLPARPSVLHRYPLCVGPSLGALHRLAVGSKLCGCHVTTAA